MMMILVVHCLDCTLHLDYHQLQIIPKKITRITRTKKQRKKECQVPWHGSIDSCIPTLKSGKHGHFVNHQMERELSDAYPREWDANKWFGLNYNTSQNTSQLRIMKSVYQRATNWTRPINFEARNHVTCWEGSSCLFECCTVAEEDVLANVTEQW